MLPARDLPRRAQAACARHALPLLSAAGLAILGVIALNLPHAPAFNPDTNSYLDLSATRPPAYGLLLNAWAGRSGGLSGLPAFQAVAVVAGAVALARAVLRRTGSLSLALGLLGLIFLPANLRYWLSLAMTEALFVAAVMLMLAAALRPSAEPQPLRLLRIGVWAALALALRNAGLPLVVVAGLLAVFLARQSRTPPWANLAAAVLPAAAVLVFSTAFHWQVNGRLTPGAWSGVSLAGKAMLLTHPQDTAWLPPPLHAAPAWAGQVRDARPPADWRLRHRVRLAQYDAIRFQKLWPDLRAAGVDDPVRIDALIAPAARTAIAAYPRDYLALTLADWVALWTLPSRITPSEREAALRAIARDPPPLLDTTRPDTRDELAPPAERTAAVWMQRGVSIAAGVIGAVCILLGLCRVLRGQALGRLGPMLPAALIVHGSFLSIAAVEGGLARYAMPIWPAEVLLCVLAISMLLPASAYPGARRRLR